MENDEESNQLIESLRQRYRREAQVAIEDARNKTKQEMSDLFVEKIKLLEEEARKWKCIAEGLSEDQPHLENDNDPKAPLLRYIMEGVYREVKKEFSDGTEESQVAINRTKRALITATEKLMAKLPNLTLRMETSAAKKKILKSKQFHSSFQRAPCLTVHLTLPSLPLIPHVSLSVDQRQSSGIFGKEYTIYNIKTLMKFGLSLDSGTAATSTEASIEPEHRVIHFIQFRRYSDFVTLHSNLERKFPRNIVPPLPPKVSTKSSSPASPPSGPSSSSEKKQTESRRRWLSLWLQYLLLNGTFQRSDLVKDFLISQENTSAHSSHSLLWETGPLADANLPLDFIDEDESPPLPNRLVSVDSKTGIPQSPPSSSSTTLDVINEAAFYKSTQETHTVLRDCHQLKPNISFAMDACKGLISVCSNVMKAQQNFARSLTGLIEAQDCNVEKDIVKEVQSGSIRTLPLFAELVSSLQHSLLEPLQFFEVDTMNIASSHVADINKLTPKVGKKYFQYHRETITDWNAFRRIRHDLLISSIYSFTQYSAQQHKLIGRSWAQAIPKIKESDFDTSEFSSSVHRGWKGLVEREKNELASAVNLLNDSHTRKREAQALFNECNNILTKERSAPSTRSIITGDSKAQDVIQSSLQHKGLSRPVIPSGTRRDPTERSFHSPGEVMGENAPTQEEEEIKQENSPRQSYSQSQLQTPPPHQKLSHAQSQSTPTSAPPADQSLQKKKKSWGSYLFGSKKSPEQPKSSTKVTSPDPVVGGNGSLNDASQDTEVEEEEDTPMNRAYQERILREERRLEEEEDRHRLGGAYVSERPEEGDDHYHEKKNRRRPPPGGVTNQRRPKSTTKPIQTQPEATQPSYSQPQPIPQQQTGTYSTRPHDSQSSSYHNPSHLHNLTQQRVSDQLHSAVRSRAKSDTASTSIPDASSEKSTDQIRVGTPTERATPVHDVSHSAPPDHSSRASAAQLDAEPLPEGWEEVYTEDGTRYFYHKVTRMSRWERPSPEVVAAVENRLNLSQKQIDESIERKRREREQKRIEEEQNSLAAQALQTKITKTLQEWRTIPGSKKERSFGEMLTLLPTLLGSQICPPGSITSTPLTVSSPPADIKKAYMKAVRCVHPDKIPGDADLEVKLLAEQIFICLSQLYDSYRKAHGL